MYNDIFAFYFICQYYMPPKREKVIDPDLPPKLYFCVNPVSVGYILATPAQAVKAKQVRYYGLVEIDKNI